MAKNKITNKRHRAFADEYLINGMNATQAYMTIYKNAKKSTAETNGQKLLHNTVITAYIDSKAEESSVKAGVTRDEIISDLKRIKDECKAKGEYPPYALKAIEILCKMLGFNEPDKLDHTTGGNPIVINYHKPNKPNKPNE